MIYWLWQELEPGGPVSRLHLLALHIPMQHVHGLLYAGGKVPPMAIEKVDAGCPLDVRSFLKVSRMDK